MAISRRAPCRLYYRAIAFLQLSTFSLFLPFKWKRRMNYDNSWKSNFLGTGLTSTSSILKAMITLFLLGVGTWFGAWGSTELIKFSFLEQDKKRGRRRESTNWEICRKHMGNCENSPGSLRTSPTEFSWLYFFWTPTLFSRSKARNKKLEKSNQRLTAKESASSMELAYLKEEPDNRREFVPLEKEGWNTERKDLTALLQAFCYKVASIIQLLQNQVITKNSILGLPPFLKYSKAQKRSKQQA